MAFTNPLSRIRLVFKRGSAATKVAVACAAVASILALVAVNALVDAALDRAEALRQQAAQLEQENSALEDKIDDLGSVDSVVDIAGDQLGLVDPDTVVMNPNE